MTCGSGHKSSSFHGIFKCAIIIAVVVLASSSASAATITVPAGGNLQSAINAAQPGDTIVLDAGATYTGDFVLPNKSGSSYITIQSSRVGELPEGVRVGPAQAPLLARLHSASAASPIIRTAAGAHHYRLIGLEITTPTTALVYDLVRFGEWFQSSTEVPHDLVIDRSYIHGHSTQDSQRGVTLNGAEISVLNSYISEIHGRGFEAQALCGWNGPGPFRIINNYLEAAGENIMFGGSDPSITNLVPSNIEIRRNYLFKPLSWKMSHPTYGGIHWGVKNLLEIKMGRNVIIDGNVLENCWGDAQIGYAVLFTVRNQDGKAPWAVVENVSFTNNTVKNSEQGFQLLGKDWPNISQRASGLLIANNLFIGIQNRWLTMSGYYNVTVSHNTHFQGGNIMSVYGEPSTGFIYTDNLTNRNPAGYGVFGDGVGEGNPALTTYTPGAVFRKNLIAAAWAPVYPTDNFYPSTIDGVLDSTYRVTNSTYTSAGTDGKDIGCDITALNAAQQGTAPDSPLPTPTPAPSPTATPTSTPTPSPTPTSTPTASPTPTPTPTPAPSPTPSPTPLPDGNMPPQVILTVPNGSRFVAGSDVTIAATAADSDGTISKVEFYRGTTLMGTDTTTPYSVVWSGTVKGNYELTAKATDNRGGTATSPIVSITVTSSPNSVNRAKGKANNLVQQTEAAYAGAADTVYTENATLASDITGLTAEITQAYSDFLLESNVFGPHAPAIDAQINAAALFSKASAGLSLRAATSPNIKNNLLRIATHLAIAEDLMRYGMITQTTMDQANATKTRTSVVIGQATTGYSTSISPIAPASIGSISGSTQPMISQTALASLQPDGTLPYEVAGLSVTVNGVAAPVLYASPFGIKFVVPSETPLGTVEVIISSQDGYICKASATVQRTASRIMTVTDDQNGAAIAANGMKLTTSAFQVSTQENFGPDKRTRLTFFATGLSGSAFNTDTQNDARMDGVIKPNYAESIVVEAKTRNNRVFVLPVEFAGAQGILTGMDQITVILVPELRGVGRVQLTLIVNGQRSNAPTVEIR
ncbi:MAG TPA: Ig-like domain-containing protein [Pyrinomonadaceae bacterium]|nr:Ig-like domain-containing protein [Pyrinomonadaceae bacterium]